MSDEKKEVKQSSLVFDIIIIIMGAIAVMLGVMYYVFYGVVWLGYAGIAAPSWWPFTGAATTNFVTSFGGAAMLPLGIWTLIAGFGLVREKAWAVGVLFVCFTLILFTAGLGTVQSIWAAFQAKELTAYALVWANWVPIILCLVALIGFIYLLATHKRYH
ncbi:MAG TPA: hypothetical protein VKM55_21805 [Candidatus Lokiarchaeia archaeon]|nr:hypothetical protein [Candidatus Lokiarchaeia archaeon]